MDTEYTMDSASDLGREQLYYLEELFDAPTTLLLDAVGVQPGWRCLDVGPGLGSTTRWLAERVGPSGQVVDVEIDVDQLQTPPGVEVHRHDISDGLPVAGTFDLIHARLVLMHLVRREQIFKTLVDALAPGGWLVLGESLDRPQQVLSAPSAVDAELADRVVNTGLCVTSNAGVSWQWAGEVEGHMAAAGLEDIRGIEYSPMFTGGDLGALLTKNYTRQTEPLLLDAGITEDELTRFHTLMHEPRFRAWPFMRLVFTAGRKPTARPRHAHPLAAQVTRIENEQQRSRPHGSDSRTRKA